MRRGALDLVEQDLRELVTAEAEQLERSIRRRRYPRAERTPRFGCIAQQRGDRLELDPIASLAVALSRFVRRREPRLAAGRQELQRRAGMRRGFGELAEPTMR